MEVLLSNTEDADVLLWFCMNCTDLSRDYNLCNTLYVLCDGSIGRTLLVYRLILLYSHLTRNVGLVYTGSVLFV